MAALLRDRVALITGATGGLGSALVTLFLEHGASVVATARSRDALDTLAKRQATPDRLLTDGCDLTDPRQVAALVDDAVARWQRIDLLVNAAGGFAGGHTVGDLPDEQWRGQLDVNLTSAFHCCRAVLPGMEQRDYGRIVNVASRGAVQIGKQVAAYTVAKAGVVALTEAIAEEQRQRNVTANVVLPGVIDTPANRQAMTNAKHERWTPPEAIGRVILFLCSDDAAIVSGASIPVYGRS